MFLGVINLIITTDVQIWWVLTF